MRRDENNVTHLATEAVCYSAGQSCPICGRPRVWRVDDADHSISICGTGQDSGRRMSPDDPCWSCRWEINNPASAHVPPFGGGLLLGDQPRTMRW